MKKMKLKNKIAYLVIVFVIFGLCFSVISANTKYYEYQWTNDVIAIDWEDEFITNDIIASEDGYVAAGFYNGYLPVVRFLDENGKTEDELGLSENDSMHAKRIYEVEDGYLVVGCDGGYAVAAFVSDDRETYEYESYWSEDFWYEAEIYYEEDDKYVYAISDAYTDSIMRIHKDAKFAVNIDEIFAEEYTEEMAAMVDKYNSIWDYETYKEGEYYPTFVNDYLDGYVYGLNDFDVSKALIVYIVNGEEKWVKELENTFIKDCIDFGPNFLVTMTDVYPDSYYDTLPEGEEVDENAYLELYDENGNSLGKDNLLNYLSEGEEYFFPEHLIRVENWGFFLTGSSYMEINEETDDISTDMGSIKDAHDAEYERPPMDGNMPPKDGKIPPKEGDMGRLPETPGADESPFVSEILYFSIIHHVETKTDGNGTIVASKTDANWGDEVTFEITPNEGFVLSEVKVTDSDGNVLIFTDYKFTMPNANVIIEATFKVENPETYVFVGGGIIAALGVSGFVLYKNRKKTATFDEVKN